MKIGIDLTDEKYQLSGFKFRTTFYLICILFVQFLIVLILLLALSSCFIICWHDRKCFWNCDLIGFKIQHLSAFEYPVRFVFENMFHIFINLLIEIQYKLDIIGRWNMVSEDWRKMSISFSSVIFFIFESISIFLILKSIWNRKFKIWTFVEGLNQK